MSNIVIHIGFPKTATTTLQRVFMGYARCAYLGKGLRDTMLPSLSLDIAGAVLFTDTRRFKQKAPELREKIAESASATPCLMLSDEAFSFAEHMEIGNHWRCNTITDHEVIADRLAQLCPKARVLMSTRNQLSFLQSYFRQRVKRNTMKDDFETFVAGTLAATPYRSILHALLYDEALEAYESQFGADRVMLSAYESYQCDFGSYLASVARFCELDPENLKKTWGGIHANKAKSHRERPTVRKLRSLIPRPLKKIMPKGIRSGLTRAFALPPVPTTFSGAQEKAIADFFAPSNAALAQRTGFDLDRWGYPLP